MEKTRVSELTIGVIARASVSSPFEPMMRMVALPAVNARPAGKVLFRDANESGVSPGLLALKLKTTGSPGETTE